MSVPYSLNELIPTHIKDNTDNNLYVSFVNMIGQHFDHIWTYIKHLDQSNNSDHVNGISKDLVYYQLKSLGIETFDQFENADLIEYILGEGSLGSNSYDAPLNQTMITASNDGSIAKRDITKEIWKRLYHNAPYLLKTKGTERGLRALMSCYGVPSTILNVKEYGGPVKDKTGYKTFSYEKSGLALHGNTRLEHGKYFIETNWSSSLTDALSASAKTVEFRIKPFRNGNSPHFYQLWALAGNNDATSDDVLKEPHLRLFPYTGSADISSSGDAFQYGKISLIVSGVISASTSHFPVYNGDFWNVFIGTEGTSGSDANIEFGAYQANFLKNVSYYRGSMLLGEEDRQKTFGDPFFGGNNKGGSKASFFGGLPSDNIPFNNAGFSGSMQEIRYHFGELLSHDTLVKHALEPFMYSGNTTSSAYDNLVLRLPLGSNDIKHETTASSYHPNIDVKYIHDPFFEEVDVPISEELAETTLVNGVTLRAFISGAYETDQNHPHYFAPNLTQFPFDGPVTSSGIRFTVDPSGSLLPLAANSASVHFGQGFSSVLPGAALSLPGDFTTFDNKRILTANLGIQANFPQFGSVDGGFHFLNDIVTTNLGDGTQVHGVDQFSTITGYTSYSEEFWRVVNEEPETLIIPGTADPLASNQSDQIGFVHTEQARQVLSGSANLNIGSPSYAGPSNETRKGLGFDFIFEEPKDITEIIIQSSGPQARHAHPIKFKILVSYDGTNFETIDIITPNTGSDGLIVGIGSQPQFEPPLVDLQPISNTNSGASFQSSATVVNSNELLTYKLKDEKK